jgi:predicted secreted Zn-dependent protease
MTRVFTPHHYAVLQAAALIHAGLRVYDDPKCDHSDRDAAPQCVREAVEIMQAIEKLEDGNGSV